MNSPIEPGPKGSSPPSLPSDQIVMLPGQPSPNSSGTGWTAALPQELNGFNWGACLGSIPWALAHRFWAWAAVEILLLYLAPPGAMFIVALMSLALGFTGNDLAWKYNRWRNADHFRRVQRRWATTTVTLVALGCWIVVALALWDGLVSILLRSKY